MRGYCQECNKLKEVCGFRNPDTGGAVFVCLHCYKMYETAMRLEGIKMSDDKLGGQ